MQVYIIRTTRNEAEKYKEERGQYNNKEARSIDLRKRSITLILDQILIQLQRETIHLNEYLDIIETLQYYQGTLGPIIGHTTRRKR